MGIEIDDPEEEQDKYLHSWNLYGNEIAASNKSG